MNGKRGEVEKAKIAYLGNRDTGARCLSDLANLATGTTDDAANHVRGDADVLSLDLLTIFIVCWRAAKGCVRVGTAVVRPRATVAEIGAVACSHDTRAATIIASTGALAESSTTAGVSAARWLSTDHRVVEDGASASLPIIDQALANFPDSALNTLGSALNFDYSLSGLREHLLLGNHTDTRSILDVLDLKTLSSNDGSHLVV